MLRDSQYEMHHIIVAVFIQKIIAKELVMADHP